MFRVICFLALRLCVPVDLSPAPDTLSPNVRNGTLFPDLGIGIHSCYQGQFLWDTLPGDYVVFDNRIYQVEMTGVYPENTDAGDGWDLFVFTCYGDLSNCFRNRDYEWDRFLIGATDITQKFPLRP